MYFIIISRQSNHVVIRANRFKQEATQYLYSSGLRILLRAVRNDRVWLQPLPHKDMWRIGTVQFHFAYTRYVPPYLDYIIIFQFICGTFKALCARSFYKITCVAVSNFQRSILAVRPPQGCGRDQCLYIFKHNINSAAWQVTFHFLT